MFHLLSCRLAAWSAVTGAVTSHRVLHLPLTSHHTVTLTMQPLRYSRLRVVVARAGEEEAPSPQVCGEVRRVVEHCLAGLTATYWPRLTWEASVRCPCAASRSVGATTWRHQLDTTKYWTPGADASAGPAAPTGAPTARTSTASTSSPWRCGCCTAHWALLLTIVHCCSLSYTAAQLCRALATAAWPCTL